MFTQINHKLTYSYKNLFVVTLSNFNNQCTLFIGVCTGQEDMRTFVFSNLEKEMQKLLIIVLKCSSTLFSFHWVVWIVCFLLTRATSIHNCLLYFVETYSRKSNERGGLLRFSQNFPDQGEQISEISMNTVENIDEAEQIS